MLLPMVQIADASSHIFKRLVLQSSNSVLQAFFNEYPPENCRNHHELSNNIFACQRLLDIMEKLKRDKKSFDSISVPINFIKLPSG